MNRHSREAALEILTMFMTLNPLKSHKNMETALTAWAHLYIEEVSGVAQDAFPTEFTKLWLGIGKDVFHIYLPKGDFLHFLDMKAGDPTILDVQEALHKAIKEQTIKIKQQIAEELS